MIKTEAHANPFLLDFYFSFYGMCVAVFSSAYVSMHHIHFWFLEKSEESVRSPVTGIGCSCELQCGHWKSNSGPLVREPVLLTTDPSFRPHDPILSLYQL